MHIRLSRTKTIADQALRDKNMAYQALRDKNMAYQALQAKKFAYQALQAKDMAYQALRDKNMACQAHCLSGSPGQNALHIRLSRPKHIAHQALQAKRQCISGSSGQTLHIRHIAYQALQAKKHCMSLRLPGPNTLYVRLSRPKNTAHLALQTKNIVYPALQAKRHGITGSPVQKHYNSGSTSQTNKKTPYLTTGQTNGTDSVS